MKYQDAREEKMWTWFHEHFAAPEECNPEMSGEYGYQYVCGGPYYAKEVLKNAFEGNYPETLISEVAADLEKESHEWIVREGGKVH